MLPAAWAVVRPPRSRDDRGQVLSFRYLGGEGCADHDPHLVLDGREEAASDDPAIDSPSLDPRGELADAAIGVQHFGMVKSRRRPT